MCQCKHENTKENSYQTEYYGIWSVVTVVSCIDCGEILDEIERKME